jgi:hypothetical protein
MLLPFLTGFASVVAPDLDPAAAAEIYTGDAALKITLGHSRFVL